MDGIRLKQLRKELGYTQSELGQKVGVIKQTISNWENNISEPSNDSLIKLSNLLKTQPNYLLGLTNERCQNSTRKMNTLSELSETQHFSSLFEHWQDYQEKLHTIMLKQNISENDFINYVGIAIDEEPNIDNLIKISSLLNISIDYLLGLSDIESISYNLINKPVNKILTTFQQLNIDNQDIIIGEAKKLLKEQYYEESVAAEESLKRTGTDNLGK